MNNLPPSASGELDGSHVPPFGLGGSPLSEEQAEFQLRAAAKLIGVGVYNNQEDAVWRINQTASCYVTTINSPFDWPNSDDSGRYYNTWRDALEDFQTLVRDPEL